MVYHSYFKKNIQTRKVTAHLDNVRQTVRIDEVLVDSKRVRLLNFGDKGTVLFTFIRHPEFIHPKRYFIIMFVCFVLMFSAFWKNRPEIYS